MSSEKESVDRNFENQFSQYLYYESECYYTPVLKTLKERLLLNSTTKAIPWPGHRFVDRGKNFSSHFLQDGVRDIFKIDEPIIEWGSSSNSSEK